MNREVKPLRTAFSARGDECGDPVGMLHREVEGDLPAQEDAEQVGTLDLEVGQKGREVVGVGVRAGGMSDRPKPRRS